MNFAGALVDPTATVDEMSDTNDGDKFSDSRCTHFDCSDTEPSLFDTKQYIECVNNHFYKL